MEEEEGMPPFWVQNNNRHRRLRRTSSLLLNSGFLIIFLLAIAFVIIFIIIPSFLSSTSKIFRPQSVKKSWDSLNLVLVLFAIVCGFLSRTNNSNNNNSNNNASTSTSYEDYKFANTSQDVQKSNPSIPHKWYEYSSDRTAYNTLQRQRSNSYPDLRQESSWVTSDDRWRFYDDTHVNNYHSLTSDQLHHRRHKRDIIEEEEEEGVASSKEIGVDTFVVQEKEVSYTSPPPSAPLLPPSPPAAEPPQPSSTPRPLSPPPPLPPRLQPKVVKRKEKRTYQDLAPKERPENKNLDIIKKYQLPPPSPPPPPPPPPPLFSKNEKKRGGASATKDFLTSLRRKKKKQRQKSVENLESLFNPEPSALPLYPLPSPPPPPPPPPPPQFFHNLFSSKKGKNKKVHSVPPPPPPLPPPLVSEAHASKTKAQNTSITTHKPHLPVKISNYNRVEENANTGNESPLNIPIPPPPPPPPFKMPEWKYVVHGDYVRIKSNNSSRSGSPDLDGVDDPVSKETSTSDGGNSPMSPLFCPSPDVDTKADNFIARFRAGLRLEKMNSVRGRSNLGLQASSGQDTEERQGPS